MTEGETARGVAAGDITPRRRAVVLMLWLAALAVAAGVIWRTPFVADLSAFLPAKPDARQRVLIEQLQSGVAARTLFIGIDGGSATQRADASRTLAAAMRRSGLFEQVHNGETDGFTAVGTWLFDHRYQLSPGVTPERFTATGLRDAIDDTLSLLGTPAGNAIKPLLDRDPTGETQRIAEGLIPAQAPRSEDGLWVSRQGDRAVLLAGVAAPGADLDAQAKALDSVRQAFVPAKAQGLVLQMSGSPVFAVDSRAQIQAEAKTLIIIGTLVMSTLLWLAFGSLPAVAVALVPVVTGAVAGVVGVSLAFGNVHGVTMAFGSTLIGETVDYAIYFLIQAHRPAGRREGERGWQHWLRHNWPTVKLGLATSVCGFVVLLFSGFPGLAQLGVFSTVGLCAAALATRYVLPVLMPEGAGSDGGSRIGLRRHLGRWARTAVQVLPRGRTALLALGVVTAAGLVWQRGQLWRADLTSLSPISAQALALDASLRADLTASEGGSLVVVQGPDIEITLQRAEAAAVRLDALVDQGVLAGYSSVSRWLPSVATQQRRLASLPEPAALRAALATATAGGPLSAQRLEPFIAEVQAARGRTPVTPAALRGTALKPLLDALLLQRADGSWAALLPLQAAAARPTDAATLEPALQCLDGVQWLDIKPELDRLYSRYLGEAQAQTLLGALAVVAVVGLWLRSWRRLLAVCQPLVLAVLLTLGGLSLLQVELGILHLVGLLLVVAVGSNYALFFDMLQSGQSVDGEAQGATSDDTLASLLLANLTTVLSFGLIAMSSIPALSAIGRVVAPGAFLALLLSAAFARPRPAPVPAPSTGRPSSPA